MNNHFKIDAKSINPKIKGKSDFFSWQLYKWVKKYPDRTTIWLSTLNSIYGIYNKGSLYIGDERDGEWVRCRQLTNLCTIGSHLNAFAYGPCHDVKNWKNVTELFWDRYMKIGVCAIHGDFSHKWRYKAELERICEYCGKVEFGEYVNVPALKWKTC